MLVAGALKVGVVDASETDRRRASRGNGAEQSGSHVMVALLLGAESSLTARPIAVERRLIVSSTRASAAARLERYGSTRSFQELASLRRNCRRRERPVAQTRGRHCYHRAVDGRAMRVGHTADRRR